MAHRNSEGEHFLPSTDTYSDFTYKFILTQQVFIEAFAYAAHCATLLTTLPCLILTAAL